jgi:hypothetical protein
MMSVPKLLLREIAASFHAAERNRGALFQTQMRNTSCVGSCPLQITQHTYDF